jgi:hypothetical protein
MNSGGGGLYGGYTPHAQLNQSEGWAKGVADNMTGWGGKGMVGSDDGTGNSPTDSAKYGAPPEFSIPGFTQWKTGSYHPENHTNIDGTGWPSWGHSEQSDAGVPGEFLNGYEPGRLSLLARVITAVQRMTPTAKGSLFVGLGTFATLASGLTIYAGIRTGNYSWVAAAGLPLAFGVSSLSYGLNSWGIHNAVIDTLAAPMVLFQ